MSKETDFFAYLLELYSHEKGQPAWEVLAVWDEYGITDFIYGMYELYHQEAPENAIADIDALLETSSPPGEPSGRIIKGLSWLGIRT